MRIPLALAAALAASIPLAAAAGDSAPGVPVPFFRHGANPDGAPDGVPGPASPASPNPSGPSARGRAAEETPTRVPSRAERLDRLFDRLARTRDGDEARGIADAVERLWLDSGSDTADLLMDRAMVAMSGGRRDVSAALLDKIIELRPGWAEAWNKRATLRFLDGDDTGAMEDISHVLAIEPRHFGALSGMGFILERHGEDAAALAALRRALAVYPGDADVRKAVDRLAPAVEGQEL